jgi:uncharacterized protein (TIGR03435 family)
LKRVARKKNFKKYCLLSWPSAINSQMHDASNLELLRNYHRQGSEAAFAELVERHIHLVYSAALRQTGIAAQAEEITQAVFVILARKAGSLRPDAVLEAWLYETTRLTALSFLRGERRRQAREQEAYMQSTQPESAETAVWPQLAPLLDEAMAKLGQKDREAVVLRYFKEKNLGEVATALHISEAAAQSRVHRAVEKLRKFFTKRGVNSTTEIIAGAISANSVQAAPVGLAVKISAVAVAKGVAAEATTLTLIKGAFKIMAWTKVKTTIVAGAVVLLTAGTTTVAIKEIQEHRTYSWQNLPASGNELDEVRPQVRILPTKFSKFGECARDGKILETGALVKDILAAAYGVAPAHVIFPDETPFNKYDFIANLPNGNEEALQKEVERKFGLFGKTEVHTTDALLLEVKDAAKLQSHIYKGQANFSGSGGLQYGMEPLSSVAAGVELVFGKPVVDSTGMSGNYHLRFLANETDWSSMEARIESVRQTLTDELDQVGLELVSTNMPLKMLVVEKAK